MTEEDTIHYNKLWQERRFRPDRLYMQERVLKTFKVLFQKILKSDFSGKVLDVGCGDGSFVRVCTEHGIEAVGIDIGDGINFEKDKLPFKDNEFDIAIMYSVIEHLQSPSNILLELYRILKKNGKLIIIVTNFELERPFICGKEFFSDPAHIHPYNRKSIRILMKIYNFKEKFMGLWTVCKSHVIWKLPETLQFYYGALLPFRGKTRRIPKLIPGFLRGKSRSLLGVFEKS